MRLISLLPYERSSLYSSFLAAVDRKDAWVNVSAAVLSSLMLRGRRDCRSSKEAVGSQKGFWLQWLLELTLLEFSLALHSIPDVLLSSLK